MDEQQQPGAKGNRSPACEDYGGEPVHGELRPHGPLGKGVALFRRERGRRMRLHQHDKREEQPQCART